MLEFLLFVAVIVAIGLATGARTRLTRLEEAYRAMAGRLDDARADIVRLDARLKQAERAPVRQAAGATEAAAGPVWVEGRAAEEKAAPAVPVAAERAERRPAMPSERTAEPGKAGAAPPGPRIPAPAPPPAAGKDFPAAERPAAGTRPVPASAMASVAGAGPAGARGAAIPPVPSVPPQPEQERPPFDWESLVGVKLFSWIAGVALALGAIFFLSYSIQKGWLQPPVRMAIGLLVGVGLLGLCELKAARRYAVTANALDGAGVAVLFSTFFASHALWNLIGGGTTFLFLALVAAVAVLLSIRRDSLFIALLGLMGGFATPALLSTGEDRPFSLFSYLLLVNLGLAWVGYRKRWAILPILSVALTTIYQWAWVAKFLDAGRLPLAMAIFLIFPVAGFVALVIARPARPAPDRDSPFGYAAVVSAVLPLLFAFHMATVAAYAEQGALVLGFLLVLDAGLLAVALARGPELLHAIAAASTVVIFVLYFVTAPRFAGQPVVLGFAALFVVFYLAAPTVARRLNRPFQDAGKAAAFAAPLLLFVLPASVTVGAPWASAAAVFGVLLALAAAIAARAIADGSLRLHALGGFFAMATGAAWSVAGMRFPGVRPGWTRPSEMYATLGGYAALSFFYLAVPALAGRRGRRFPRHETAGMGILSMIAVPAFGILAQSTASLMAGFVIFGLVGLAAAAAAPALAGSAKDAPRERVPRALLGLAAWDRSALPLCGLLFLLFFVAPSTARSLPPWPWLAVAGVILLAIGAAVLRTGEAALFVSALVVAQASLLAWLGLTAFPSAMMALAAALGVAAFALGWAALAGRAPAGAGFDRRLELSAVVALVLAQAVAIGCGAVNEPPALAWLVVAHVALLVALHGIAARRGWHVVGVAALVPAAIAVFEWQALNAGEGVWLSQVAFALAVFLVFLAYPLAIGRRVGSAFLPYLGAALASLMFFFAAHAAIEDAQLTRYVGALPVAEAGLMAILLVQLLRLEPPGARTLGRLAFVAATVLAFITAAIPLQLEKEWITIGWALEAAALAWLFLRIPHRGLLYAAVGLAAVVFIRLAANPEVLAYYPRGSVRLWNWYLYTYAVTAAAFFVMGRLLAAGQDGLGEALPRASGLAYAGGAILLFLLLNIEIADFFAEGATLTFNFSAGLAQDLSYTLGWALFAVGLLAVGIAAASRAVRAAALGLLVIAILKAFLHDLGRLGGLYRVGSFVGLAVCLSLVAVALQKFVLARRAGEHR